MPRVSDSFSYPYWSLHYRMSPLWSTLLSCLLRFGSTGNSTSSPESLLTVLQEPGCRPLRVSLRFDCETLKETSVLTLYLNYLFFLFNRFSHLSKKRPVYFILALSLGPTRVDSLPGILLCSYLIPGPPHFNLSWLKQPSALLSPLVLLVIFFQWFLGTYLFR